ncbi:MAG: YidC/Oxa1 family membrane protein insertase [Clostridiales bacterium]|nr:YidC/Oxa1 family membrane protein insertase [Clostridiales bacterium]MDY4181673.1 membrane protein insertase YidC [Pseudoflavonifractor sp.]
MKLILTPFVWVLNAFYSLTGSYGLALILFAIVVKLILFPFQLKGKKSMIQMNLMSGQLQKLQKQYGKDKERYNQEVQKLYEREHVNPMGGCLWSFLPLFILIPLYSIIREPLVYMMNVGVDNLAAIAEALNWSQVALDNGWIKAADEAFRNTGYNQLYLSSLITPENLAAVQSAAGEGAKVFAINFDFLGIFDLARVPKLKFWTMTGGFALFLLPVISALSSILVSWVSQKTNAVNQQAQQADNASMKMMFIMMPLMSLWIGFSMPAALCLYWIIQNLLSIVQEFICGKMLKKDYEEAARIQAEREQQEKEEEKERKRQAAEERARRIEEAKSAKGKKKKELMSAVEKDSKGDSAVIAVSGVGMRSYARGRAYDPNRFSPDGPTAYQDPDLDWAEAKKNAPAEEPKKKGLFGRKKSAEAEQPVDKQEETPTEEPVKETEVSTAQDQNVETEAAEAEAPFAPEAEEGSEEEDSKE